MAIVLAARMIASELAGRRERRFRVFLFDGSDPRGVAWTAAPDADDRLRERTGADLREDAAVWAGAGPYESRRAIMRRRRLDPMTHEELEATAVEPELDPRRR